MCISEQTVCLISVSFVLRGQSIRVTLWGGLADMLIEKKATHVGMCPIVVTSTSAIYLGYKMNCCYQKSYVFINLFFIIICRVGLYKALE
jgi:hypothetical protein